MNDLNHVVVEGRMTKDPILGVATSGSRYCFGSIASNRFFKAKEEKTWNQSTIFFDIRAFGEIPEEFEKAGKGDRVRVSGRLEYDGREEHEKVFIRVESVAALQS